MILNKNPVIWFHLSLVGLLLLVITPVVGISAQDSDITYVYTSGQAKVTTPDIVVKVTSDGNVPHYFFWARGDETTEELITSPSATSPSALQKINYVSRVLNYRSAIQDSTEENDNGNQKFYHVKFQAMFEFEDRNSNGVYDIGDKKNAQSQINFPASTWSFSDFDVEELNNAFSAIHFNFTHDGAPALQFRNHVRADSSNQLKFDIVITDYSWYSDEPNIKLAIKILFTGSGNLQEQEQHRYTVGSGFFRYNAEAEGSQGSVEVASSMEGQNAIYLCYDYFGASLTHDPELGISSGSLIGMEFIPVFMGVVTIATLRLVHSRRRAF